MLRLELDAVWCLALLSQMIMLSVPGKPFSYTGKGTTRRQVIIKEYTTEIEAMYDSSVALTEIAAPQSWSQSDTLHFVRSVIRKVLGDVGDGVDIFQSGCDRYECSYPQTSAWRC